MVIAVALTIHKSQGAAYSHVVLDLSKGIYPSRSSLQGFQLLFHNVQSLSAHIDQIVKDRVYLCSGILLLAETWFTSRQNISIPSFKEVARENVVGINLNHTVHNALIEIERSLDECNGKVVIAGDFNFNEESPKKTSLNDVLEKCFQNYVFCIPFNSIKNGTFIDNIYTNFNTEENGRHISFTSYHDFL
ncbi:hypothetical protein BDF21DRAFT_397594 [Thamnidium elegans]|nr:hypothetical protein BDF21DRAFT_397594 [Thamnidium elegans]